MSIDTLIGLLAAAVLTAVPGLAAEHRGQVQFGGLPLPGATVTLTQADRKLSAITDQLGAYSFSGISDGTWSIQIEMLCFSPIRQEMKVQKDAEAVTWELKLLPVDRMRAASPAAAPAAHPMPAAAQAATNSPSAFRRADVQANTSAPPGPEAAPPVDEELTKRAADGFLINGSTNNGASSPFMQAPAFGDQRKGSRSLYNASLGLIVGNSNLDARSFSLTGQDTPKPHYNHLTGLLSLGGPLKIPRLIRSGGPNVVLNYQWTRNRNATTQSSLMPSAAERNGDLSQTPKQIFDPGTGLPLAANVIPQSRISPQAIALLTLYPLPNFNGGARYNYQIPLTASVHQDSLQTRANKGVGRRNQIFGNFAYQSTRTDDTDVFGLLDTGETSGINAAINWRYAFTQRFSGTLGYQYSHLTSRTTPYFANRANVSGNAGISGNNQDPVNWGPPSLGFAGGITGLTDANHSINRNQTSAVSYGAYWTRGRHGLSIGGDLRRQQFNVLSQENPRGTFTFTGASTQATVNGAPAPGTSSDFAGFLLGIPDTSAVAFGNADKYFRASSYDLYLTDDWRVNPGFTLNAGARWEYGSPITELYGRLANLDIAPAFADQKPVVGAAAQIHPDKRGFQPRIGFSWRPFDASSMVVRGGYGVYYNTSVYQWIAPQMAQQSPLSKSLSVQNSVTNPLTLANGFNVSSAITPNTFAVDPYFRVGYAQNWQLSVQRDLPGALVFSATYLGIKGTRGLQQFLPNTYPLGALNPCPVCPTGFAYLTSNGNSTRQSGQLQLRRRLHNGFMASLQYTFSKSIDDAGLGGRSQGLPVIAQNWLNLSAERGLSNFDQRHLITAQMQYSTGMGVAGGTLLNGWKGRLFKEWNFAAQVAAGSGLPLTPVYLAAVNGTGVTGSIRPDYTGASVYAAPPGLFLNPAAFQAPEAGQWGDAGRGSITGPAQFTSIASMGRTFRAGDHLNLDVRIDSSNPLNHPTFPSWNTTVTSTQFGLPNTANSMRTVQTTLRARF